MVVPGLNAPLSTVSCPPVKKKVPPTVLSNEVAVTCPSLKSSKPPDHSFSVPNAFTVPPMLTFNSPAPPGKLDDPPTYRPPWLVQEPPMTVTMLVGPAISPM